MSRKSYQKVTLSVELTLPPGAKAKEISPALKTALVQYVGRLAHDDPLHGLDLNLAIIKITKRETIYTS